MKHIPKYKSVGGLGETNHQMLMYRQLSSKHNIVEKSELATFTGIKNASEVFNDTQLEELKHLHLEYFRTKDWSWGRLDTPDCAFINASCGINTEGYYSFGGNLYSDNPGSDSWGARFHFMDNHGVVLWSTGEHFSPTINAGSADTAEVWWTGGYYPAYLFDYIVGVSISYRC